jgi:hypothetical protein
MNTGPTRVWILASVGAAFVTGALTGSVFASLKAKGEPSIYFIGVAEPKADTETSLQAALREMLIPEVASLVVFPLASTPGMREWAARLTAGATNDFQKARMIFNAVVERHNIGSGGSRAAPKVFEAWDQPEISFRCQELVNQTGNGAPKDPGSSVQLA